MSGSDGHTHSKHMWAELKKIGPPPKVEAGYMPGHGSNFSCEFSEGGRDSTAVNRTWLSDTHHGAASVSSLQQFLACRIKRLLVRFNLVGLAAAVRSLNSSHLSLPSLARPSVEARYTKLAYRWNIVTRSMIVLGLI